MNTITKYRHAIRVVQWRVEEEAVIGKKTASQAPLWGVLRCVEAYQFLPVAYSKEKASNIADLC